MKQLYNKITGQAESLKGLWVAKLNLKGRSALATADDLHSYESKKKEVSFSKKNNSKKVNKNFCNKEFYNTSVLVQ